MQLRSFLKKTYSIVRAAPIAFAFFVITLVGTIMSFSVVKTVLYKEGEIRFNLIVQELRSVVVSRLNHTIDLPVTMSKSISIDATKGELDAYLASLDLSARYPGAREVGIYATSGPSQTLRRFYRYAVVPGSTNLQEVDLKNATKLHSNLKSTEPLFLKLRDKEAGYVILVPMKGKDSYVYMVFDTATALNRLFAENSLFSFIDFRVFDTVDPTYALYETNSEPFIKNEHTYVGEEQFKIGLYPWSLIAAADNRVLVVATARRMPAVILMSGISIAVLMFGILFALSWSRKSAIVLAENITRNLKLSEEKYRSIFESLQDVYYRTNKDGMITTVSPSVKNYVGLPPESLIGKSATSFYKNPTERNGMLAELAKNGIVKDYPLTLVGVNGALFYCSLNAHIVKAPDGTIAGVEGLIRDVSGRKRADDALLTRTKELERLNNLMIGRELRMIELKRQIAELTAVQPEKIVKAPKTKIYGKD
jgi:PAS domain S-box-containing protein